MILLPSFTRIALSPLLLPRMSFSNQTQNQKTTMYTITSETAARRVIGRGGSNIKTMRQALGNGLYIRVEATKTRRVAADQLSDDGYVKMKCANSNGVTRTVNIFVGTSPPRDDDGNILVMVKPVMVSAWTKAVVDRAIGQIDAITNRRESDLTTKVSSCPGNLIKHVIGARGSGLRRIEHEVGDGCYISCTDGVFVIKANSKKSSLRGKIVVEKKIKELVERFRFQKKDDVVAEPSALGANPFDIFGDDESDDESNTVVQDPTQSARDGATQKKLSKSVARRLRRKATAKAKSEKLATEGIVADDTVLFVSAEGDGSYDDIVERTAHSDAWMRPSGKASSDSSDVEDTTDTTSESTDDMAPLSGVWGDQKVTISEALEDAVSRGDAFMSVPVPEPKKRYRKAAVVGPKKAIFEIMTNSDAATALDKTFDDMAQKFAVGAWDSDSE